MLRNGMTNEELSKRFSLGENLRRYRKMLGLTQIEEAERIYASRDSIIQWESGKRTPDFYSLIRLADLYNIPLDVLANRAPAQADQKIKNATDFRNYMCSLVFNLRTKLQATATPSRVDTLAELPDGLALYDTALLPWEICVGSPDNQNTFFLCPCRSRDNKPTLVLFAEGWGAPLIICDPNSTEVETIIASDIRKWAVGKY